MFKDFRTPPGRYSNQYYKPEGGLAWKEKDAQRSVSSFMFSANKVRTGDEGVGDGHE